MSDTKDPRPLEAVFTPAAPVTTRARFAGRRQRLAMAEQILRSPGRHLLVLGEPGFGRTSFALTCAEKHPFRYHQVGLGESFDLLLRRLLDPSEAPPSEATADLAWKVVDGEIAATVLILDDLDRGTPEALEGGVAPLLRALSDRSTRTQVVLVARSDGSLPPGLRGLGLRLAAIELDRMDSSDLEEIVESGARAAGFTFEPRLRQRLTLDADGLPGLTHALALEAARSAQSRRSRHVRLERDYLPALAAVVTQAAPRLRDALDPVAPADSRGLLDHLLWAGALGGGPSFTLDDVEEWLSRMDERLIPPQDVAAHLDRLVRQEIFTRTHEGRYRFVDPVLRAHVLLRLRQDQPRLAGRDPLQLGLPY